MHRTQTYTLVFALAAAFVTLISAALAYEGVHGAFEREFARRLSQLAHLAASQLSPADIVEAGARGPESDGYLAIEVQLEPLTTSAGLADLALVDRERRTLYDRADPDTRVGQPTPFDTLAHAALSRVLAGARESAAAYRERGLDERAVLVPVRSGGQTVAVLVMAAAPTWQPELRDFRNRLVGVGAVSVAAIAVLAGFLMRQAGKQLGLERQLSRSENLAAMGRLTATLAHEIKNPLAIIRGSAKRLGRLEPEAQRMADSVIEEVDRLTRTVGRFLQFARTAPTEGAPGDAAGALAATLDLLEGEFAARHCRLERGALPGPTPVRLEDEALKQVYLNLLLNALEAAGDGGAVRVALARDERHVTVEMHDSGPGIPAEMLKRLGEPFQTTKAQGSGLGLFLCRRLVTGAGGELRAASPPGAGTTLTIRLPLAS